MTPLQTILNAQNELKAKVAEDIALFEKETGLIVDSLYTEIETIKTGCGTVRNRIIKITYQELTIDA